jgi:phosphatidylinositol alpha-mannosyltransferase
MKIGIVSEYYYPLLGGITEHVHFFSKECARLGHEVTLITSNPVIKGLRTEDFGLRTDVEIIRLGHGIPYYSNGSFANITIGFGIKRKMKEILKSKKFDILHVHSPSVPVLPIIAHVTSTGPTVGTFHTYFEWNPLYFIYRNVAQDAIENLDGRIAVSRLCVESLQKYFTADFTIIPNGVDIEYFSTPLGKLKKFNDGKINILFLARLDPRNGLECLIKAFSIVHKKHKNTRLIVVGDGPLKWYFKTLVDHTIENDVHFEGFANGLRPDYFALSDIFCFPVQKASFGITILEAMAAARPIVCSDLPAFHDILGGGGACRYIDPYEEHDLAGKLMELIENESLRKSLGLKGKEKVERYSWKNITKEVLDYYKQILSSPKPEVRSPASVSKTSG